MGTLQVSSLVLEYRSACGIGHQPGGNPPPLDVQFPDCVKVSKGGAPRLSFRPGGSLFISTTAFWFFTLLMGFVFLIAIVASLRLSDLETWQEDRRDIRLRAWRRKVAILRRGKVR